MNGSARNIAGILTKKTVLSLMPHQSAPPMPNMAAPTVGLVRRLVEALSWCAPEHTCNLPNCRGTDARPTNIRPSSISWAASRT